MLNGSLYKVLEQHPEAGPYLELRREWRELYRLIQDPKLTNATLQIREREAWTKMRQAYHELPVPVKVLLLNWNQ